MGNRHTEPLARTPAHASSLTIAALGAGGAPYQIGSFRLQTQITCFHKAVPSTLALWKLSPAPPKCGLEHGYVISLNLPMRSAASRRRKRIGLRPSFTDISQPLSPELGEGACRRREGPGGAGPEGEGGLRMCACAQRGERFPFGRAARQCDHQRENKVK